MAGRPGGLRSLVVDLWRMTRVNRSLITNCSLVAGFGFAGSLVGFEQLLVPFLAFSTLYASSSVLNDILDLTVDRVTNRERPLPSGRMSVRQAWRLWFAFLVVGLGLSNLTAVWPFLLAYAALGITYALWGKRTVWGSVVLHGLGHFAVPFMAGYAVAAPLEARAFAGALFSAALIAPTITIKDFKDVEGDRRAGLCTLPLAYGEARAYRVLAALMLLSPLLGWVPWAAFGFSLLFLLLFAWVSLWKIHAAKLLHEVPKRTATLALYRQFRFVVAAELLAWAFVGA